LSTIKGQSLEQILNIISGGQYRIIEPVECSKYKMDGHQVCSVVDSSSSYGFLNIVSQIGDRTYLLIYGATHDNFDKNLPIAQHMINSFKFGPEAAR
jgi:hypothetical protein